MENLFLVKWLLRIESLVQHDEFLDKSGTHDYMCLTCILLAFHCITAIVYAAWLVLWITAQLMIAVSYSFQDCAVGLFF